MRFQIFLLGNVFAGFEPGSNRDDIHDSLSWAGDVCWSSKDIHHSQRSVAIGVLFSLAAWRRADGGTCFDLFLFFISIDGNRGTRSVPLLIFLSAHFSVSWALLSGFSTIR